MPAATTRADFAWTNRVSLTLSWSSTDAETGDDIDYSAATEIVVEVRKDGCLRLRATLSDGTIDMTNPLRPSLTFTAAQMATLCPDTYDIGAVYETPTGDGQSFVGTLAINEGVARLP